MNLTAGDIELYKAQLTGTINNLNKHLTKINICNLFVYEHIDVQLVLLLTS